MERYVFEIQKLKTLCVNCVIKNFDRLMLQYESGKVPQMLFRHLQITQSPALLEVLLKERRYQKYMKFLLNSSAKKIDLRGCQWNMTAVMKQLLTISHTITDLSISASIRKYLLSLCRRMVKLESLTLHDNGLNCVILRNIGRFCTSLKALDVSFCSGVTDKNITALCPIDRRAGKSPITRLKNTTLKSIDIHETSVSCIGIAFILEHFPNIEFIRHLDVFTTIFSIHWEAFGTVDSLKPYNLKRLIISTNCSYLRENALDMCRALCPRVNELSIGYLSVQSQLDALSRFTELTKICITSRSELYLDVTSFIKLRGKNLRVLSLKNCGISTPILLNSCPKLITLKLEDIHFESTEELESMPPRYHFEHLEALHIENMNFSNISVSDSVRCILSSAPNLEKLTVLSADCILQDFVDSLAVCDCMDKLRTLNLINTEIEGFAATKLLQISPNVKKFNLKDTPIRFQDYQAMLSLRPFRNITTDYSAFVLNEVVETSDDEDSWMNDYKKGLSDTDFSGSEDSEFEPGDSDEHEENYWSEDENGSEPDDDNWEFESDYGESSDVDGESSDVDGESSDVDGESSDVDGESSNTGEEVADADSENSSIDDENDSSWDDEEHENSSGEKVQAVPSRKRRRSSTEEEEEELQN